MPAVRENARLTLTCVGTPLRQSMDTLPAPQSWENCPFGSSVVNLLLRLITGLRRD